MNRAEQSAAALETSIQYVKGVGPRLAERFAVRGIRTVGDALFFLPRHYEDRRARRTISELSAGETASFVARVLDFGSRRTGPRRQMFEVLLGDETGQITCRWFRFNAASFKKRFERGQLVRVAGKVEAFRGVRQLVHPDLEKQEGESPAIAQGEDFEALIPLYPEVEGVFPKSLRRIMRRVVDRYADCAPEILPERFRHDLGLMPLAQALKQVHFPPPELNPESLEQFQTPGHRRLIFEEFFLLQLGLALRRRLARRARSVLVGREQELASEARQLFGFDLTGAQRRVVFEILDDMAGGERMNRLLQGDVGAGKTAVAVLIALAVARAGAQTALMAPTEILAEQHQRSIASLFVNRPEGLEVVFLSSAVKGRARAAASEAITSGRANLVVGTQALIEEAVGFSNLGLVIIDEQHRFGVMQRARLRAKGNQPHVLVMTATPIPRTLAMTVYGDLDVSVLDEMPPGRTPVRTVVLRNSQVSQAYRHVRQEVQDGGQAFLVYPLVEESEKMDLLDASRMFEQLGQGALAGLKLGLLHGRLAADEKDAVMQSFVRGDLDVLVATTVVEVGVDVPRATVMVIEHAERFGLSQLHQLRGRVGRGQRPGSCYLVAHSLGSQDARARLRVMERTNDGFLIAEEDLAIRGPGEFLGTRQSGLPLFAVGDLTRDAAVLMEARQAALELIERDGSLASPEHAPLKIALRERWGQRLMLAEVG